MLLLLLLAPFLLLPIFAAIGLYAFVRCQLYQALPVYLCLNITEKQIQMVSDLIHKKSPGSLIEMLWQKNVQNLVKFRSHGKLLNFYMIRTGIYFVEK